jgi:V8-like Glu-specific endopeptidase
MFIAQMSVFSLALSGVVFSTTAFAETAPARRAVVPADAAPEAMSPLFSKLAAGEQMIAVPGAAWLQLQLADVALGDGSLTITSADGQSQTFSQAQIDAWQGLTAVFNGDKLSVTLTPRAGEAVTSASVADIIIGLPASGAGAEAALSDLLGDDLKRFVPDDAALPGTEGVQPADGAVLESICGATDDRIASSNPRAGRIEPIGCTGWLIDGGAFLTAGHCDTSGAQTVEFNVPASLADGTNVAPAVRDQYRIAAGSMVSQNGGQGNDWAVFRVVPNTETGLMPAAVQGATFQLSNTQNPAQVRITGYGVDGPGPGFGAGGPRDATNQTQQTHSGALGGNTGGPTSGTLSYSTDTQGGNSGSPVLIEGTDTAIGIHTNAGCTATGGTNAGTSFRNQALWAAVQTVQRRTGDVLWQHINGQVHYWPMLNGQRQGGINIAGPVGPEWKLIGGGDFNGDGTEDALWQHINGQVHWWPMLNGVRQGGLNIAGPVGPEWRLIGAGDLNGDGTDDILWQHINGQVHYWPMLNGARQGGIDIAGPVGPEWKLIGSGDFNNDGTDDILWQHINGQVHWWPMLNGVRQGGLNIAGPVGPEWRIAGAGDLNADGTDDILWQHINGQVHWWPILTGVRQGGLDIAGPVGPEWRLKGVASLD